MKKSNQRTLMVLTVLNLSLLGLAQAAQIESASFQSDDLAVDSRPLHNPQKDFQGSPEKPLTQKLISQLKELNEAGRVYEAWNLLAQQNDGYATSATRIFGDKITVERCVVESNWKMVVGEEVRQEKYLPYAQLFQSYYIDLLNTEHRYPNSLEIEKMYQRADDAMGLPQSVSVDLMMNKVPEDWDRKIFFDELSTLIGIGRDAYPKRWYDYTKLSPARTINESITAHDVTVKEAMELYRKSAGRIAKCMSKKLKVKVVKEAPPERGIYE